MAFFLPQGPPPALNASVQYRYHTLDGGPPSDGKPPGAATGPPPPHSPLLFCGGAPPAPPGLTFYGGGTPGSIFPFCAPPAPPAPFTLCAPARPDPFKVCYTKAPAVAPGVAPNAVCLAATPPEPPKQLVLRAAAAAAPPSRAFVVAGPSLAPHPPDPGNRVNERIVKADDGTGVLCSEDMTTFHVLNPGRWFDDSMTRAMMQRPRDFIVQHADSDWSVQKFIKQLGGLQQGRLSSAQATDPQSLSLICAEQWIERENGRFERASAIFYQDDKARMSLRDVGWGPEHGKAGQERPVWIMLYPQDQHRAHAQVSLPFAWYMKLWRKGQLNLTHEVRNWAQRYGHGQHTEHPRHIELYKMEDTQLADAVVSAVAKRLLAWTCANGRQTGLQLD